MSWNVWNDGSGDPEDDARRMRAKYQSLQVMEVDPIKRRGVIASSHGGTYYRVTENSCDCMDFKKRGQTCKHMYKLLDVLDNPFSYTVYEAQPETYAQKEPLFTLILCVLFGMFGVHHFYVGRNGMGILYLFTGGLFCIGWIRDIYLIATGCFRDVDGHYLRPLI